MFVFVFIQIVWYRFIVLGTPCQATPRDPDHALRKEQRERTKQAEMEREQKCFGCDSEWFPSDFGSIIDVVGAAIMLFTCVCC